MTDAPMLLFGVSGTNDNTYSDSWRLVSVPSKPELVVIPQGALEKAVHVTYHPSGAWFFRVLVDARNVGPAQRLVAERIPGGFLRLLQIQVPPLGRHLAPAPDGVTWIDPPENPTDSTYFEIVQELKSADLTEWPERAGGALVGRLPVADGTAVAVIAHHGPSLNWTWAGRSPTEEEVERMRAIPDDNRRALLHTEPGAGLLTLMVGVKLVVPPAVAQPAGVRD